MVRYILKQNKNKLSQIYSKWFAYPVIEETVDLDGLSEHMSNHNSPYSKGVIKGLLTDMIGCIKELLLEGKNVKGIKNKKGGAPTEEEFTISKNIEGVKFRARATGTLLAKSLNLDATLKKATAVTGASGSSTNAGDPGTPTNGDNNSTQQPTPSGDIPGEGD